MIGRIQVYMLNMLHAQVVWQLESGDTFVTGGFLVSFQILIFKIVQTIQTLEPCLGLIHLASALIVIGSSKFAISIPLALCFPFLHRF